MRDKLLLVVILSVVPVFWTGAVALGLFYWVIGAFGVGIGAFLLRFRFIPWLIERHQPAAVVVPLPQVCNVVEPEPAVEPANQSIAA